MSLPIHSILYRVGSDQGGVTEAQRRGSELKLVYSKVQRVKLAQQHSKD